MHRRGLHLRIHAPVDVDAVVDTDGDEGTLLMLPRFFRRRSAAHCLDVETQLSLSVLHLLLPLPVG